MALEFEELRVLKAAEAVADGIWRQVVRWEAFARDTVGKQMALLLLFAEEDLEWLATTTISNT